jgi:hypothetical protein
MQEVGKNFGGSIGDTRGCDGGWTEETSAIQAGEDLGRGGEEGTEAESKEIGRVARAREYITRDFEMTITDLNEDFGLEQLGHQSGHCTRWTVVSYARDTLCATWEIK